MTTPSDIVPAIPIPCAHVDAEGRIMALNEGLAALFGADCLGRHYITVFRQPTLIDRIEVASRESRRTVGEFIGRAAGRDTTHKVTISPIGGAAEGQGAGLLVFFEDVTHLAEAGERRSEFVANVSHELRTPLTAIAGFIETLRGPARDDAEARDRFLEIMARETGRMNRLVDDLLSLARVEDVERMRPEADVDVAALLNRAVTGLAPQAAQRAVRLSVIGCDTVAMAPGDPDQLTQVFTNLIENSIKYGREAGQVEVRLERLEHAQLLRGPGLRIVVRDEGEGIDARHLGRLTERFYRVDSHRSRGMGGTGLGLAIVKHIVNRHRGRLRIESEPGQGSTFSVFLPTG
ncbi:sensor histidine kinase [Sinisalibacter lacisalsi]|uniref:histidine kinase n=1 Tax=Sinisalibacter lacisalsi TaxID=1526570 RepID=A0ABQ1QKR3_9RHOB|nr:ATP-binding protein [Sinisalibacter lacisalsi]GGD31703.1 two-component sensor histidine kinase [Sinisalibacter lacisalsi]